MSGLRIAVAGTGYIGLSISVLLAQHNNVMAVDIVADKVEKMVLQNNGSKICNLVAVKSS